MKKLRTQIESINQKIAQLFSERKGLVRAIVAQKNKEGVCSYDPSRECFVFEQLKPFFLEMDTGELLSFSILMESQVASSGVDDYPRWSLGEHLADEPKELSHRINPFILKIARPKVFSKLPLREGFQFTRLPHEARLGGEVARKFSSVIAIDGPSGSGKSVVAKKIAQKLNLLYIDTGAMYRAVALAFYEKKVNIDQPLEVKNALFALRLDYGGSGVDLVKIDGVGRGEDIRQHFVSDLASKVSQLLPVRKKMVSMQRELARNYICVMEGRDIGTVVFPNAFVKFFLHADSETRAKRRLSQLKAEGRGESLGYGKVYRDIKKRDEQDKKRKWAPLVKDQAAIEIDSSHLTLEEVVDLIEEHIGNEAATKGIELT